MDLSRKREDIRVLTNSQGMCFILIRHGRVYIGIHSQDRKSLETWLLFFIVLWFSLVHSICKFKRIAWEKVLFLTKEGKNFWSNELLLDKKIHLLERVLLPCVLPHNTFYMLTFCMHIYTYNSPTEYKNKLIHKINLLYICMFFIHRHVWESLRKWITIPAWD